MRSVARYLTVILLGLLIPGGAFAGQLPILQTGPGPDTSVVAGDTTDQLPVVLPLLMDTIKPVLIEADTQAHLNFQVFNIRLYNKFFDTIPLPSARVEPLDLGLPDTCTVADAEKVILKAMNQCGYYEFETLLLDSGFVLVSRLERITKRSLPWGFHFKDPDSLNENRFPAGELEVLAEGLSLFQVKVNQFRVIAFVFRYAGSDQLIAWDTDYTKAVITEETMSRHLIHGETVKGAVDRHRMQPFNDSHYQVSVYIYVVEKKRRKDAAVWERSKQQGMEHLELNGMTEQLNVIGKP